jgi:hypothetical protein
VAAKQKKTVTKKGRGVRKAPHLSAAEKRSLSALKGWETRRKREAEVERARVAKRARDRAYRERKRLEKLEAQRLEVERLAKIEAKKARDRERARERRAAKKAAEEAARLEAERLEVERLAKIEAKKARDRERARERRAAKKAAEEASRLEAEKLEAQRLEVERLAKIEAKKARDRERARERRAAKKAAEEAARLEAARLEAQRLEVERLAKIEAKKARDRERARERRAEAKRKKLEAERAALRAIQCEDLERNPSKVPEVVWSSDCFVSSTFHRFPDGTFEGLIYEKIDEDNPNASWRRVERFLSEFWKESTGWWMRVGVFGVQVSELFETIERADEIMSSYEPIQPIPGRPDLVGAKGSWARWRRVGPSRGKRTRFVTAASQYVIGRQITEAFLDDDFTNLVLAVAVYSGEENPS